MIIKYIVNKNTKKQIRDKNNIIKYMINENTTKQIRDNNQAKTTHVTKWYLNMKRKNIKHKLIQNYI